MDKLEALRERLKSFELILLSDNAAKYKEEVTVQCMRCERIFTKKMSGIVKKDAKICVCRSKNHMECLEKIKIFEEGTTCKWLDKQYHNWTTPMNWECSIHGKFQRKFCDVLARSVVCIQCHHIAPKYKLTDEKIKEYCDKSKFEITGPYNYVNCFDSLIPVRCLVCKVEYKTTMAPLIYGRGCRECGKKRGYDKLRYSIQHVISLVEKRGGWIEPENQVQYVNSNTKYLANCGKGHTWETSYHKLYSGYWCNQCNIHRVFTIEEVREILAVKGWTLISKVYKNIYEKCHMICDKNHEVVKPFALIRQNLWCAKCYNLRRGDTVRIKLEKYYEVAELIGYECLATEQPKNSKQKIQWKCDEGHIFEMSYDALVNKDSTCTICSEKLNQSKMEMQMCKVLDKYGLDYVLQKKFDDLRDIKQLSYDAFIPQFTDEYPVSIAIEMNGKQHYEPIDFFGGQEKFKRQVYHDTLKTRYCIDNEIALIVVKYDENVAKSIEEQLISVADQYNVGALHVKISEAVLAQDPHQFDNDYDDNEYEFVVQSEPKPKPKKKSNKSRTRPTNNVVPLVPQVPKILANPTKQIDAPKLNTVKQAVVFEDVEIDI